MCRCLSKEYWTPSIFAILNSTPCYVLAVSSLVMLRSKLDLQNTLGHQVCGLEREKFSKSKKPELTLQMQTQQLRAWNQVGACSTLQKYNNQTVKPLLSSYHLLGVECRIWALNILMRNQYHTDIFVNTLRKGGFYEYIKLAFYFVTI